ncbi:MAG: MaoC family dehydratase N-terminal domain-containing protein [Mycobacterium sp.]
MSPRLLDDETIEAVRRRIGIPIRRSARMHNEVCSVDSFRQFAQGYGDDNPLYCDPEYSSSSSWGAPLAPPLYPYSAGKWRRVEWTDEQRAEMKSGDPLSNIGQYVWGERWSFVKPVRAGDVLVRAQSMHSADLKASSFGGGYGALVSHRVSWEDESGSPYAVRFLDYWHADRDKSREAGKDRNVEAPFYTDEDLARIDELYATESQRGAVPLVVGDVAVGDELGPIVKGPMTVSDIVCWHAGIGMGDLGLGALKLAYKNRQRMPGFYQKDRFGAWDGAIRLHWDKSAAARVGQPETYDYGFMRTNWMVHLITNWMGDDAWIWQISFAVKKFNYAGDVHYVSGTVRGVDPMTNRITIDVDLVNQRDELTAHGTAVVILPASVGGVAQIPAFDPADAPEAAAP